MKQINERDTSIDLVKGDAHKPTCRNRVAW